MRVASFAWGLSCAACTWLLGYGDAAKLTPDAGDKVSDAGDTGVDLDGPMDVDSAPFCSTLSPAPLFCASFDRADYLQEWASESTDNATLSRETVKFLSPPAALSVTSGQGAAGVGGGVHATFPAWANKSFVAEVRMAVRVERADSELAILANPFALIPPSSPPVYLLQLTATRAPSGAVTYTFNEVDPAGAHPTQVFAINGMFGVGSWTQFRIVLALVNPNGLGNSVKVFLNGDPSPALDTPLGIPAVAAVPVLNVGVEVSPGSGAVSWDVRFDNVTVDFR